MKRKLDALIKTYNKMPLPVKASFYFFICSFMQKGISVITTPIFTRLMSTSEYGVFNIYMSWTDLLSILLTWGLSSSVYQKKLVQLDNEKSRDELTSSLQGLATTTCFVALCIYLIFRETVNNFLNLPTGMVLSIFVGVLATTSFGFWAMRLRVNYRYKKLVLITIFTSIAKPAFGIMGIFLFPSHKVEARIYTLVLVEVVTYIGLYVYHFVKGKKFYSHEYWKYAIAFVLPLIPHYLSQRILSQSDKLMISQMIGSSEAGIYSLAHSVGWLMTIVITALDNTLAPWTYTKLKEGNVKRLREFSCIPVSFMSVMCLIFTAVAPELVNIFASSEYYDAIWIIPPMVLSTFFMSLYTMFIYVEYYFEKTRYIMAATAASAIINIILNYIFIVLFGYYAAAYTSLFCYLLYTIFHYIVYKKVCKEKIGTGIYAINKIIVISLATAASTFLLMLLYNFLMLRLLIILVVFITVFVKKATIKHMLLNLKN